MHQCEAKQYSDQMVCNRCNLRWDVNDPEPPACSGSAVYCQSSGGSMNIISFTVSEEDRKLINQIVSRALRLPHDLDADLDETEISMDIVACHANGCPLDLERLLHASQFDFVHDIHGIHGHMNRRTGKLEDHFLPRFAKSV